MKILVTGSAGFVFSNFIIYSMQKNLEWYMVGVDNLSQGSLLNLGYNPDIHNKRHKFSLTDISNYSMIAKLIDIEKPDIIINGAVSRNHEPLVSTNITGTHNILEAIRKVHTPSKFIHFSTGRVFGPNELPMKELSPMHPKTTYDSTRASAEMLCQTYAHEYGLPIIIARSCNVFGGRQGAMELIPRCVTDILSSKDMILSGNYKMGREWIYVMDVFRALSVIIRNGEAGEEYNIGSGTVLSDQDVALGIIEIMQRGRIEYSNPASKTNMKYMLDSSKIMQLGWKPQESFAEALARTVKWYSDNRWSWK